MMRLVRLTAIVAAIAGFAHPGRPDLSAVATALAGPPLASDGSAKVAPTIMLQTANGLTAVAGIKVGHYTLATRPTGCTVILTEAGAVASVDVRGAAPGTRETDLLEPGTLVEQVHAILLTGGSAHGLDAASGVMRFLEERKIGFEFGGAYVPIVPAAVIFDLPIGGKPLIRPDADCGYQAARTAASTSPAEGSIGAGAGATVGKFASAGRPMKGGVGTAAVTLPDGLVVAALVVVNAAGDIIDPASGRIVAGARTADGAGFVDLRKVLRSGAVAKLRPGENSTIGVVATNAVLTKAQAKRMAMTAHDGYARAIFPVHTMADGDTIFALATGTHKADVSQSLVDALAAQVMAEAILRAVREATGLPGYPAVRDLK